MVVVPECAMKCKNWLGVKNFGKEVEEDDRPICKAFPEGIPTDVIDTPEDHKKPLPEQSNGIVFELRK